MNLMYLIISIVIFLISAGSMWYGTTSKNTTLIYSGLIIMISSLVAAIYFFITKPESRTTTPYGPLDDLTAEQSWTTSQKLRWATWLETNTGTLTTASQTTSTPLGIKSIVVRRNNGTTAELPIMDFFKQLHNNFVQYNTPFKFKLAHWNRYVNSGDIVPGRAAWALESSGEGNGEAWEISRS